MRRPWYATRMTELSCHCGQVRLEVAKTPDYINECNCTLCAKSGARWAYFAPADVSIDGPTATYQRVDKVEPAADVHFCGHCGSTTHFTLTQGAIAKFGNGLLGVNMWLANEADLAGIELRYPDGKAWSGEGEFHYVREARVIGG